MHLHRSALSGLPLHFHIPMKPRLSTNHTVPVPSIKPGLALYGDEQKASDILPTVYIEICERGPCSTGSTELLTNANGMHSNGQLKREILKNNVASLVRRCNGTSISPGGKRSASLILKLRGAKKLWQEHVRTHIVKGEPYSLSPALLRKCCLIVIRQAINVELYADIIDLTNDETVDWIGHGWRISNITKHQLINEPFTEVDTTNRSFKQMTLMSAAPASSPTMTSTTVLLSH